MNIGWVGDGWRALAGVAGGYALAAGLILVVFFVLPYLVVSAT
ncbi:MAG: hypothetical protein PPP55_07215 [Halorubrum sp.]